MNGKTGKRRGIKPDSGAITVCDIRARKEPPEDPLQSHERLLATLAAAEDCIFVVDPVKFGIVLFNKAFENLVFNAYGIRLRPGMRVEKIAPDRAAAWNNLFRQVLEHGKAGLDYEVQPLSSTYRLLAQPLLLNGRVNGICVFAHDITDQKRMQEALRKSEEKFSKAFREGPIALALTSLRDHRYLEVNEAFLAATGWSREEVIGRTPFDIGLWVRPEHRAEAVLEVESTGAIRNTEFLFRTKTGEVRHGFGSATIIEIDQELCMLAVTHDITHRKRAGKALEESEEWLRLAIESGRMYAFEWDPATDLVKRSEHSESILDIGSDESLQTKQEIIDMIVPDDRDQYVRTLTSLTPDCPSYRVIFRLRRNDGNMLWLEESGRAFFHPDGRISKVVGMIGDVTESRESERALRELSGRLISTQEEERRRIARELHDHIGQELALLCVQAQRVASGKVGNDGTIPNGAQEIYQRIKNIAIDVSKLSHRLHSTELDFLGLAIAAERLCRDFSNQYGIAMDFASKNLPPKLDINKTRCFYRVLQEALQNVAKHSHASQVTVRLDGSNNQLVLKIVDNGLGFDAGRARFESGLGLVSIRERLHLIGGKFKIISSPGSGTTLVANVAT